MLLWHLKWAPDIFLSIEFEMYILWQPLLESAAFRTYSGSKLLTEFVLHAKTNHIITVVELQFISALFGPPSFFLLEQIAGLCNNHPPGVDFPQIPYSVRSRPISQPKKPQTSMQEGQLVAWLKANSLSVRVIHLRDLWKSITSHEVIHLSVIVFLWQGERRRRRNVERYKKTMWKTFGNLVIWYWCWGQPFNSWRGKEHLLDLLRWE